MGKIIKAVKPFIYKNNSNFKLAVYNEWVKQGGQVVSNRKFEKYYESLAYHIDLPALYLSKKEARLRFVEGASLRFDTFPDYLSYEIIPVIWDCWPKQFDAMAAWFKKHKVRTAIFTSSQTADKMRNVYPDMNILTITEGIETNLYHQGKDLKDRSVDYLEYGRCSKAIDSSTFDNQISVLSSRNEFGKLKTREQLIVALADSKITIALPRSINQPEIAGDIETLTQRYWECMLSRIVMVGKAPKELVDLIGYNPVVDMDFLGPNSQILEILDHIEDYQELVDKNRQTALEKGDWSLRIRDIMSWLTSLGYIV